MQVGDVYQHRDMVWLYLRVDRIHTNGILDLTVLNPQNNPTLEWAESVRVSFDDHYIHDNYKLFKRGFTNPDWEV